MENNQKITNDDILMAINEMSKKIDEKFERIDEKFEKIDEKFERIDEKFEKIDQRFDKLEKTITRIDATMVTKDYLDRKLADLKTEIGKGVRKEDDKVDELINVLTKKKVLDEDESRNLKILGPFNKKEKLLIK